MNNVRISGKPENDLVGIHGGLEVRQPAFFLSLKRGFNERGARSASQMSNPVAADFSAAGLLSNWYRTPADLQPQAPGCLASAAREDSALRDLPAFESTDIRVG